jgi:hypothetical protein
MSLTQCDSLRIIADTARGAERAKLLEDRGVQPNTRNKAELNLRPYKYLSYDSASTSWGWQQFSFRCTLSIC